MHALDYNVSLLQSRLDKACVAVSSCARFSCAAFSYLYSNTQLLCLNNSIVSSPAYGLAGGYSCTFVGMLHLHVTKCSPNSFPHHPDAVMMHDLKVAKNTPPHPLHAPSCLSYHQPTPRS